MPIYSAVCQACHKKDTIFAKIVDRDLPRSCSCGGNLRRIIDKPSIRPEIEPYESPASGRVISSRAQRREDLKATGSIEYEPGIRQDIERNRVHAEEKAFRPIAEAVDSTVAALVAAGKLET